GRAAGEARYSPERSGWRCWPPLARTSSARRRLAWRCPSTANDYDYRDAAPVASGGVKRAIQGQATSSEGTVCGGRWTSTRLLADLRLVASDNPRTMSRKPTPAPRVNGSPSRATPSARATAGLTYVIAWARSGPTSAIRAKKTRKARAVQTTPKMATETSTWAEGSE